MTKISFIFAIVCCLCTLIPTNEAFAKTQRSHKAIAEFKQQQPCPATGKSKGSCPGYVIDHVKALACGGEDAPSNMQWQTVAEGKAKDKWERKECGKQ